MKNSKLLTSVALFPLLGSVSTVVAMDHQSLQTPGFRQNQGGFRGCLYSLFESDNEEPPATAENSSDAPLSQDFLAQLNVEINYEQCCNSQKSFCNSLIKQNQILVQGMHMLNATCQQLQTNNQKLQSQITGLLTTVGSLQSQINSINAPTYDFSQFATKEEFSELGRRVKANEEEIERVCEQHWDLALDAIPFMESVCQWQNEINYCKRGASDDLRFACTQARHYHSEKKSQQLPTFPQRPPAARLMSSTILPRMEIPATNSTSDDSSPRSLSANPPTTGLFISDKLRAQAEAKRRARFRKLMQRCFTKPWTEEEVTLLKQKYQEYGPHWAEISKFFVNRSDNNIKNKWREIQRSLKE